MRLLKNSYVSELLRPRHFENCDFSLKDAVPTAESRRKEVAPPIHYYLAIYELARPDGSGK